MPQEMNKKAVADIFCIEDARAVCEAIGGLGLNPNDEATDEPLDYTPDNILDVTVNENPDGMPAFPQLGNEEMDNETKAFVVDELTKQLQADGRESLTDEDLIPFMVKIKGENHISQDLSSFIDQITSDAGARLSAQNTSEAQPNGVATDLTNSGESAGEPAATGMGGLPPEAPGGLAEPTEAPALDANADDSIGDNAMQGNEPGADGDFNLDVPEPGAEVGAGEDGDESFNLDVGDEGDDAPAADDTDTVGELDFGDEDSEKAPAEDGEGGEGGSEEDDLFSTLDGMSDEELDDGTEDDENADTDKDEKPAETEADDGTAAPVIENPGDPNEDGGDDGEDGLEECVDAKLESIRANYTESVARERVRAVVESYEQKRAASEKRAMCESIIADYKARHASDNRRSVVESTMGKKLDELGSKVATLCESTGKTSALDAKFESILDKFKAEKASEAASNALDAKLESIIDKAKNDKAVKNKLDAIVESVKTTKAPVAAKPGLDAKLESILANVKNDRAVDAKLSAIVESVKGGKAVSRKATGASKSGLDAKLESIIAATKKKIAASK